MGRELTGCFRGTHSNVEEGVGGEALRERMGITVRHWSSHMHSSRVVNLARENIILIYTQIYPIIRMIISMNANKY